MNSRGFYIALEQRILLDAAGVATAVETLPDHIDTAVAAAEDVQEREAVQGLLNAFAEQPSESASAPTTSLIFIDSRVENPEQLLANSLDKSAEIYTIEAGTDGLKYIADILSQYEGKVDSLHIISHGNSGELLLGNKHLTSDSLSGEDGQYLALMSERLDNEADILFYACNVAEGEDGKRFVEQFALITGADVAASTDLTGSSALGGDAELEFSTGNIEAQQVIGVASLSNYAELLGTPDAGGNVTLTNTSGGATSITEDAATPGAANVRLTPTTLNDGANPTPTEVRITGVTGGTLTQTNGDPIVVGAAGTKLTLTSGNYDFRFTPDANRDTNATFTYAVVGSGGETNSSDSTATISITAVNDAPAASNVSLPAVNEDTSSPAGTAVSALFTGANFSDVDSGSSIGGILVVSNSADIVTQGAWEYSTDGTNFFGIGDVADNGTALALSASTQLRFVPASDYSGTPPALTVRVVDNTVTDFTSGGSRVTSDSSSNGGSTGVAAATNTVGVSVTAVNDAPTITEAGEFADILEDQSPNNGVTVTSFLNGLVSDIDNGTAEIGLAITGTDLSSMSGSGSDWQYSTNGGTDWVDVGTVSNTSALLLSPSHLIRFNPAADQAGSGTLTYKAWDASSGTAATKENLTTGDSNRVSGDAFTSSVAVTPVNDDPVRSGGTKTIEENTTYVLQTADLAYTAKTGAPDEQSADQIVYQLTTLAGKGNVQKQFGSTWATLAVGGLFSQSDIDSGKVRYVHTGAELSANDADSFVFTVRDGAGSVLANQNFNFTITNVNAPLSLNSTSISVNEFITSGDVNVLNIGTSDADNSDVSQIQFTLKSLPNASLGKLEIDKGDGSGFVDASINDTFTKADLNAGKLRYVHNGTEPVGSNASTTFTVDATDNSSAAINTSGNPSPSVVTNETITLNIQPINDTPERVSNVPVVAEGGTVVIDENFIDFTDPDSASTQFTVILDTVPTKGALFLNGVRLGVGSMLLRSDLLSDKLEYRHFDSNPDADADSIDDSFNFTMRDRDGATISATQGIKVTPNDADSGGDTSSGVGANNDGEAVLAEGGTHIITNANLARTNTGTTYTLSALPTHGTLKLSGTTLDLGANNSFTAADITSGNLTYVHDDTENFTDTFTFKADGGVDNTFNLAITPVNEAPVINTPDGTTPVTITVTEHDDTATAYSNTQDVTNAENAFRLTTTQLSGSDIDLPPDSDLFYELTGKPPGGEIMIWNGTAYESLTKDRFTVQDVKDGKVAYFHNAGKEPDAANDKFTVKLTDGGATDSAARTINITVNNSNDAPSTQAASFTISEGATQNLASILDGKYTDSDADDTPANLTLVVTAIPTAGTGVLKNTNTGATLAVNSEFTKSDLDNGYIVYEHAGGEFFTDSFSYKARDDGSPNLESTADQVSILIRPVNDDPTIGTNTGIVTGDNRYENETFTITSAQLSGADGDHDSTPTAAQLKQIQYRVTSNVTSGTLTLNGKVLGAGSVFTQADVNNGLLKYQHTDESSLTDAFSFQVSDAGGGNEPTGTFNIALNPVNDSPELVVPSAVTLLEEGTKTITGVTISDEDSGSSNVVTTLTVTKGTVTFANTSLGGAAVVIAGDGKSLTITGTVSQVNTMLGQGVQYTGAANEVGADTLTINVNDQGNTGTDPSVVNALSDRTFTDTTDTGGAGNQQAEKTVGITLLPVNDAPTIGTFTTAETILEDTSLTLGNLSFADVDVATGNVSVTLKVNTATGETAPEGKITVNGSVGGVTVSNNTTNTVTVTGTLANINTLLNTAGSITYAAKDNFNGSDTLNVTISDLGNTGAGGAKSASHDVAITITPDNDAPDVSTPVAVSGNEDTDITVKLEAKSLDLSGNPNSTITGFTVTTLPNVAQGVLYKADGTTQVVAGTLLTKTEAETLIFKPVANSHADASFVYTATDGALTSASQTGTITVNAVNDTPTLSVTSSGVTYQEGSGLGVSGTPVDLTTGAVNVTDVELITTDEDSFDGARLEVDRDGSNNSDDVFTIDVVSNTAITLSNGSNVNSTITIGGDVIGTITKNSGGQIQVTFSALAEQSDVNTVAQAVYYQNTSDSPPASVNLDFRFRDGNSGSAQGSGGNKLIEANVTVAITSANDAPVGKNAAYNSAEDATNPTTFTLSEANVLASDADSGSSMPYVAITGNAASANALTQGVWEYSTNSGSTWASVGAVTDSSSIVVAAGSLVRFVPVADYNGVPGALSFRPIDNTSANIIGTGVDVSTNGGTTAIDGTARTITATITSVNDAPALAANQLSPTATENGTSTGLVPLLNSTGTAIAATDVDATHFDGGSITVSLDGYLTGDALSLDGTFGAPQGVASTTGGTASNFIINLNSNATPTQVNAILAAIRFSHTGDNPTDSGNDTTRTYSIKLNDGGQSNGPGNTGTTGTPQDSNTLTGTITLVDQNDSPTGTAVALAAIAEDVTNPAGTLISSLSIFTDKDGNTLAGIAISANNADATTEGVWQYQSNGQTAWAPIGTATDAASIVLQANSKVRFVPAANFTGASADSLSVRVLDSTYAGAYSNSAASTVSLNTSGGTGVESFATVATAISINVTEVNDSPTFSDVGGTVNYTESSAVGGLGTAVLLDTDAKVADIELSGLDNIADDDFGGATLTVERKGTASADDVFAIEAGNSVSLAGNNIQVGGVTKAVLTTNTGGSMLITFSAGATDANVESIMRQISFANKSDQPPTSVVVEYTFNDKNGTDQGTGGEGTGKAEVTVNIAATNDTPVATPDTGSVTENSGTTTVTGNAISDATADSDADGDDLDVSDIVGPNGAKTDTDGNTTFTIPGTYGSLVINKETGAYTYTIDNTLAATQALDDGVNPVETFNYTVADGNGGSATSTIKITVNGANDAPVANPNTDAITEDTATETGNLITDATADSDVDASDDLDISDITGPNGAKTDGGTTFTIPGTYGSLVITKETGAYTYTLDNANATVIALGVGETLTETFNYTLTDGTATDNSTLTMTINGRNDSPVGSNATLSVAEDTTNPTGTLISSLSIYSDADGDAQKGIAVTANQADATTEGVWQYSSDSGTTWTSIGAATDAASVVLQSTSLIRFVPVANFTGNSADSLSVRVLDTTYAGTYSDSTGSVVTTNTSGGTGIESFATTATTIAINVTEVNDEPVFSDVGGTVNYTESAAVGGLGTAVILDADAKITDIELSGLDNIADNDFGGATLTIERKGTVDTNDVFAIETGNGVSLAGSNIQIGGATKAVITTNANGSMVITFSAGATDANVESIMRQISFANKSDQPPTSALIEYTFNDKNTGDQGTGLNATGKAEVTVNITATNDTPVATPDTGAVTENSGTTTSTGNAITDATADSDADGDDIDVINIIGPNGAKTDTDSNTTFTIPGTYGSLVINKETGAYTYTLDNSLTATQALDDTDKPVETFTYTVSDGNGASASATIKITVNGANDAPMANANTDSINEDSVNTTGNLITDATADSDVDDTSAELDISTVTGGGATTADATNVTVVGNFGTLVVNKATGAYTYTLDNTNATVDGLGVGQSTNDVFTYTLTDGTATDTATLTVKINGQNNTPVATANVNAVTENAGTNSVTGNALTDGTADSDVDGDDLDVSAITGPNGTSTDNTTTFSIEGVYGTMVINKETGAYTYTLDNSRSATQALDDGDKPTEVFNYTINDGQNGTATSTITVTVNGANDAPVANSNTKSITTEDTNVTGNLISDSLADTDVDDTDLDITAVTGANASSSDGTELTIVGTYGTLVINEDSGAYTYTLDKTNAAVTALGVGQSLTDTFTYTLSDKTATDTSTLAVTINLNNVDPVASADSVTVTENDANSQATGTLLANDSDGDGDDIDVTGASGPNGTATDNGSTITVPGVYGSLLIDKETGAYTYSLDNTRGITQQLDTGDFPTETFTYAISDGQGGSGSSTLTVTVAGTNDAPTASSLLEDRSNLDGTEGININVVALAGFADADDSLSYSITNLPLGLSMSAEGLISGTIDKSASRSAAGGLYAVTITATDDDGAKVDRSFNWVVVNPAPIANSNVGEVTEDGEAINSGNLITDGVADRDPDGDVLSISAASGTGSVTQSDTNIVINGTYGTLVITKATGSYEYTLDNSKEATDALTKGKAETDVFSYTLVDADGGSATSSLVITVNGANDGPTATAEIASQSSDDGAEDVDIDVASLAGITDTDGSLTYTATGLPPGLSISAVGVISGTIDKSASQGGDNGVYSVTVTATDGNGEIVERSFNWEVKNPVPVANTNTGSVTEDGNAVSAGNLISGAVADSDPDGDVLSISDVSGAGVVVDNGSTLTVVGTYGTLVVDKASGSYTYTLDNDNSATDVLDLGDTVTDEFSYTLVDADGGSATSSLVMTVNGANDAPTISSPIADTSVSGGDPVSIDVSGSFADVDADDSVSFSAAGLPSGLSIDSSTGIITGTPVAGSSNGGPNSNGVYAVTVSGTDSNGRLVSDTFNLTVGNSPPIAQPANFGMTAGAGAISGSVSATDPDNDTISSFNLVSGTSGLSFNSDGSYSFDPGSAFDDLAEGETRTVSFTYTATDPKGAVSAPATVSITVTGQENITVPGTGDSGTPSTGDAGTGDPETGDPGTGNPSTGDPGTGDSGNGDPSTGDPGTGNPSTGDPGTGDSGNGDPSTGDLGTGNPSTGDPGTGDSGNGDPSTGDPGTGNPSTGDPSTGDSGTGDPSTGDPGTGNPSTGDPSTGDSGTGDPSTGDAGAGDPSTGDPSTGDSGNGDPSTGDPGTGNPSTSDPSTGDPGPGTEPEAPFVDPSSFDRPTDTGGETTTGGGVTGTDGGVTNTPAGGDGTSGATGAPVDNPSPTNPSGPTVSLTIANAGPAGITQLSLTLALQDQLVTTRGQNLFSIPANAFDNGGVSPISVEVVLSDGSALPDFVIYNPDDLSFIVDGVAADAAGVTEVIIRVTGSDNSGASVSGTFTIIIVEGEVEQVDDTGQAIPVPPPVSIPADDQAILELNEIDVIASASESDSKQLIENELNEQQANSFFDKLDLAANEDNFESKIKKLLDDLAEIVS